MSDYVVNELKEYTGAEHYDKPNPSEKILRLGKAITDRIPNKFTGIDAKDPEYWGTAAFVTEEMADIALKMKRRKHYTMQDMIKLTGLDEKYLTKILGDMAWAGILEYNDENPTRTKQWVLPVFVPGSGEFTNMREKDLEEHPELAHFFEQMARKPLVAVAPMVPPGGGGIGMHVIPVEKEVEMEQEALDIEKISYWLDKYDGKYAKSLCSCRANRKVYGENAGDDPRDWCIAVGSLADFIVETERGEYCTRDEVMEILQHAEEMGYVHQTTNIDGKDKIFAICNCNPRVCLAIRTSQMFNQPNFSRSAYVADVEKNKCVACGKCVEVCPAGAVKLGQKLCDKQGKKVEYPKFVPPYNVDWDESWINYDWRDTNRVNCYDKGTAPCKTACPAHVSVQGYLKLASKGKYNEALALIKKDNPFPAVCGRICNKRCEDACTRGTVDEAVAIDDVKRFLAQRDLDAKTRYIPKKLIPSNRGGFDQKIAIIGSGPAGLSCAYYLAMLGYKPTVFEKSKMPGGLMTTAIPSFRLEKDVVQAEIEVIKDMGVEIKCGVEVGRDITVQQLRDQGYEAFYVAIGLQGGGKLGVDGNNAEGVLSGLDFVRYVNISENVALDGDVVVIGGGNVACDVARTAKRCGAQSVTMLCLESAEEMPCSEEDRAVSEEEGINIMNGWGPDFIESTEGKCQSIVFKKCARVFDMNGAFNPKFDANEKIRVKANYVLYCIGQRADWGSLLEDVQVELNPNMTVKADPVTFQTAKEDVFAGGDIYHGASFCIDAIEEGKKAAESLHRYVQPGTHLTIGRNRREFIEMDKENITLPEYDTAKRQKPPKYVNTKSFRDLSESLTEEQVKIETARCLSCGASEVDANRCIGCGMCTVQCEFDAIHLHRENPECSNMISVEEQVGALLKNAAKRKKRIMFGKKTPEEKAMQEHHKQWKKTHKNKA